MAYTALYRKFRPQQFEDVKGQDHIVTTLKNQIKADRIGHAYLFCGTRGTGKTTVAKMFAKAVNCENPVDGSPCGTCACCRSIADGSSMNVIEIDAASNNGVDNIRQIREEVTYRPTEGRMKVYIIDEVHMLPIGAFNALLKTLEEPPSYVMFILATTEMHKIPITILSRCQRYDFHRISNDTISDRLMELMKEEQIDVEEKAIRYVAKAGDGSMRDALSLLDQCIAFYLGQTLTYDHVLTVLGAVDMEVFSRLLRNILDKNVIGAIALLEELVMEGRELGQFVTDFIWYLRNLLLLQSSDGMEELLDVSSDNLVLLKEETALISPERLMRYIRVFSELGNQLRYETQKRIMLEIAIIKLCTPQMEQNYDSIVDRLEDLEYKMDHGMVVATAGVAEPEALADGYTAGTPGEKPQLPKAIPEDIQKTIQNWKNILAECGGMTRQYVNRGIPTLGANGELLLFFDDANAYEYVYGNRADCLQTLKKVISERVGKEVEVLVQKNETGHRGKDIVPDLTEMIRYEIEEEDF